MIINSTLNYPDKVDRLQKITEAKDLANKLFYSSRNLKIEESLYKVRKHFENMGFKVNTDWRESSFGETAAFVVTFLEKRNEFEYRFVIYRKSSHKNLSSDLVYLARSGTSCYTRYQISADHQAFIKEVQSDSFFNMLDELIKNINYPFYSVIDVFNPIINQDTMIEQLFTISKDASRFYFLQQLEKYFRDKNIKVSITMSSSGDCQLVLDKPNFVLDIIVGQEEIENVQKVDNKMYVFKRIVQLIPANNKSKKVAELLNLINSSDFDSFVRSNINCMNYPFAYQSHSSF